MPSDPDGLTLRPADPADAQRLAQLLVAARDAAYPLVPASVHAPDDVQRWLRGRLDASEAEVWAAEEDGRPVGVLLLEKSWVHSLYIAPDRTGEGIGSALLELAKARRPRGLGLWVFVSNEPAQRFYLRHGFREVRRTDGSENEERRPDIEMAWP